MEKNYSLVIIALAHQDLRHSLRRFVEPSFERMIFADDHQSLIDTINSTDPDVLLVEMSLPCGCEEGMNVLRCLKKAEVTVPAIAIGDYDDPEVLEEVDSMGAAGFVLRTELSHKIVTLVDQVLTSRVS